jgi:hypothetical protein
MIMVDDDDDECGAIGGMMGTGNLSTPISHFVHHKPHMI